MNDDLQRRTHDYYASETIDDWIEYVYPTGSAPQFPFGHARALVVDGILARHQQRPGSAYDLGCGAGQLAILLARRGYDVHAVDFSQPMLARAAANAAAAGVADKIDLIEADLLAQDVANGRAPADVVLAMGLLEYCPEPQRFFARLRACLGIDGIGIIEFRNRLFNALSGNAFTSREVEGGELQRLLRELDAAWHERPPTPEDLAQYFAVLSKVPRTTVSAASPGVVPFPVDRRQHTFNEICQLAGAEGLEVIEILGLHPHPFAPVVERSAQNAYNAVAWALQQLPRNPLVLMSCSSAAAVLRVAK